MAHTPAQVGWSEEAAAVLATARATKRDLAEYRQQVDNGAGQLWRFPFSTPTYLFTRVEQYINGDCDLVMVAGAGANAARVIRWASRLADRENLSLRAHITRPGLKRLFERNGCHQSEIVMRRDHGQ